MIFPKKFTQKHPRTPVNQLDFLFHTSTTLLSYYYYLLLTFALELSRILFFCCFSFRRLSPYPVKRKTGVECHTILPLPLETKDLFVFGGSKLFPEEREKENRENILGSTFTL